MTSRRPTMIRNSVALLLVSLFVAACGGSTVTAVPGSTAAPPSAAPSQGAVDSADSADSASPGGSGTVTGHVGDTLTFAELGGDEIDVTLVKVLDPATTSDSNNTLPAGSHWVGIEVTVNNHSNAIAEQSAAFDGIGSDGTRIDPTTTSYRIGGFSGCTPTSEDPQTGQPYTLCTGFVVPDGISVASVGVRVGGGEIFGMADQAVWTNP